MNISIQLTTPCEDLTKLEKEMNKLIEADRLIYKGQTQIGVNIINTHYSDGLWTVVFGIVYEDFNPS